MESTLVGYARLSKSGNAIRVSIDAAAFKKAETYDSNDGRKFVSLIVNTGKVQEIIAGEREVTSVVQLADN